MKHPRRSHTDAQYRFEEKAACLRREVYKLTDDDELGCLSFEIDKKRFAYRITEPYTEERKALARAKMNEINNKEDNG